MISINYHVYEDRSGYLSINSREEWQGKAKDIEMMNSEIIIYEIQRFNRK